MPALTRRNLYWKWCDTCQATVVYCTSPVGPVFMGRTMNEAISNLPETANWNYDHPNATHRRP